MKEVKIPEERVVQAAGEGMDAFIGVFVDAINSAIGGELTAETMQQLNADQTTLLAYDILRDEVMNGGFVQLIHNGYGPFFFKNPFGKMMRLWGVDGLARLLNKARSQYHKHGHEIEREMSYADFMAMFEQQPDFEDIDDEFIENEEEWTQLIACYIDDHTDQFATILK